MPKLYYVRSELGSDGQLYPTLKEAQDDFQAMIDMGEEPEGVHTIAYQNNRRSVAALVNMFRVESD